jgi:hypothetical protein
MLLPPCRDAQIKARLETWLLLQITAILRQASLPCFLLCSVVLTFADLETFTVPHSVKVINIFGSTQKKIKAIPVTGLGGL